VTILALYKVKKGSIYSNKDAKIIGNCIENLMKDNAGEISAKQLLDTAKSIRSPLHKYFDWDDTKAAEKWRLHQSRQMLSSIVVTVNCDNIPKEQRCFVNVVNDSKENVYVPVLTAINKPDYLQQLIKEAQMYINHFNDVLTLLSVEIKKRK